MSSSPNGKMEERKRLPIKEAFPFLLAERHPRNSLVLNASQQSYEASTLPPIVTLIVKAMNFMPFLLTTMGRDTARISTKQVSGQFCSLSRNFPHTHARLFRRLPPVILVSVHMTAYYLPRELEKIPFTRKFLKLGGLLFPFLIDALYCSYLSIKYDPNPDVVV
jgi:hypothetical protein